MIRNTATRMKMHDLVSKECEILGKIKYIPL